MRIGVDGYNLAMPHGTGVSTYATELVGAVRDLGHEVDGIFGLTVPRDRSLRQPAFFDSYRRLPRSRHQNAALEVRPSAASRVRRAAQIVSRHVRAFAPHPLREVPIDQDHLGMDRYSNLIPAFDRLVSAGRLFEDAMMVFARTGRFMTVRLPDPPEIMHWTYPIPIRMARSRNVYTLHDLVPLKLPHTTLDDKAVYGSLIAGCLRHADQICTVSRASEDDIVERYGVNRAMITTTYQTAPVTDRRRIATQDADDVESLFGLKRQSYFLYAGAIEPKKNIGRLLEAFLLARTSTPLVIVGSRGWQSETELQLMPQGGTTGGPGTYSGHCGQTIIRLEYLPRDLLAKLIRGAKAVVFPSLYEGFGLPVLEAMQLGTPVITSNTSSLPEVAGDAGLLVDPYDVGALMAAMRRVDTDAALCRMMSVRGLEQAKLFSRERYLERLTHLYAAAMARR